ncbi:transcription initiation factor TFIID subunit 1 isoform X1 [Drosophila mauritiana]|uniref:Transcription initiation factor TFIID subunit 1 n=1 Tax=Drosophila mauritiana TaxID=7226 RepID=A0A1B1AB49_DROMA|nr:transcription initiation factor TFIID subunit 1 isoform X1 [Drosophila mauritiana]ANP43778.1 TATA-box binding protein associated factor 1 [Drosophila mauritiana]
MEMESDNSDDEGSIGNGLDLTGILFGNIDSEGRLLQDDEGEGRGGTGFDAELRENIGSLSKLGLDSMLLEVIDRKEAEPLSDDEEEEKPAASASGGMSAFDALKAGVKSEEREDGAVKAQDDAIDYSDITELSEDCPRTPPAETTTYDDLEDAIPASKVEAKLTKDDKELMPPPSAPMRSGSGSGTEEPAKSNDASSPSDDSKATDLKDADRKLDTPLADILPSKYQNVDVRELFPDFRPQKVLRFSRLFGPGKPTSLPQIWRHVRNRRRKRNQSRDQKTTNTGGSDSASDTEEPRKRGFSLHYAAEPTPAECMSDDEDKLLGDFNSEDVRPEGPDNGENSDHKPKVADWRFGPAQIWYDMLEVPDSGEGFNYGFKTKAASTSSQPQIKDERRVKSPEDDVEDPSIADDAFLMVSQLHWEDDVVWDGNDIKAKVLQKLNSKTNAAGWLPSSGSRTAGAFSQPGKPSMPVGNSSGSSKQGSGASSKKAQQNAQAKPAEAPDDTWYSLFPVENEELIYYKWEDEVIWDAQQVSKVPKPKVLTLDPNDENIILGIPDDIDPSKINKSTGPPPKIKIPHPHVKKSKILLGKAGVINVLAEDTPPPPPKSPDRDPFNISNDTYYTPKTEPTLRLKVGGNLIQHSTPVVELRAPFVPTHMGPMKLRSFHRPPLKKYSHGPMAQSIPHPVFPLLKTIAKKAKQREVERIASGGGDVFFMRNPEDLSGRDGDIVLAEFCEEHPPLINQVGMCSKIKNYYKRKAEKDSGPQDFVYGEVAFAHTSPFLGILHPGQCIQAIENNMYRAPIYPHKMAHNDFLVIRTRNNYWIRSVNSIYTVGQECPLYEVPGPNSKRANNFTRDFLQVFIYRLFWKSRDNPRRIRMDDIKQAFPAHSESSIRKRLKQCADFKRTGMDSNWWVIKPEFRLPSEEEIRAMVSPEQCCAYFSMIAAEQRLKDAGYGEKFLFAPQEDDDEEAQLKLDDEVKVAPWNTTRAYIQAMRGKCLLQLSGPADPTGCGEGFSYVRVPNKPTQTKEEQESQPKRSVTGTDADLRRLPLQRAKELLRQFKVPEEEIKKLSRWEVIDVVRTLSTEKAKAGEEGMDKFSRGNRFSIAEHQERYKEECQRIFDLQNRVLASSEVLSTDEAESSASEESDLEELGKNLENMLSNKKTSTQLSREREELERQELLRQLDEEHGGPSGSGGAKGAKGKEDPGQQMLATNNQGRILRITRTFRGNDGKEYTRVETVRRQPVIDAYIKIRTTKDEQFIKQFATLDEQQKEEMKREKRRIQEQLRRIKRNQERERLAQLAQNQKLQPGGMPTSLGDPKSSGGHSHKERDSGYKEVSPSRKKFKLKPDLKLKCGACGQVGHMRTNKACPLYSGMQSSLSQSNPSLADDFDEQSEKEMTMDDDDLVNVDGTKVTLSSKILKRHGGDDGKRRSGSSSGFTLKVPRDAMGKKKRRVGGDLHCDYLQRHNKTANRRRTDPVVVLSSILEIIHNELRSMPDVSPFLFPVSAKKVPDYYRVVTKPMDLQTMREYIRQRRYTSREMFLEDLKQIVDNSLIYNGPQSAYTLAAQRMFSSCFELLAEREDKLMRLEKAINPLLDDDDQVALSFIFDKLHSQIKQLPESWPFLKPVNKKQVKDYYTVIKRPMDLETIGKNIEAHRYHSRAEYLADIELIATNCEQYNGSDTRYTKFSKKILEYAQTQLIEFSEHCGQLENNIAKTQERARENAPEFDEAWGNDDYNFDRGSRASSPGDDYIDVEGHAGHASSSNSIHRSMGAEAGSSHSAPAVRKPAPPGPGEVKRGRGRPRKQRDPVEEVKSQNPVKRGRGRPRKDSLASNMSHTQAYFLDEDLQCSTDDEDDDEEEDFQEVSEDENNAASILDQGERINAPVDAMDGMFDPKNIKTEIDIDAHQMAEEPIGEDDSQQVAEAMVQLSGVGGYYAQQQQDESMDVDPNYDPSDFLAMHKPRQSLGEPSSLQGAFTNFLSHEQDDNGPYHPAEASTSAASGAALGMDDSMAMQMATEMPVNTMNNGMGIDDDLDISESDEEDDGSRVRIKKEVFDDGDYALQHQQMGLAASQSQIYMVDSSNEPTNLDYQQPPQLDFQQVQGMEQLQHQVMPPLQPEQLQQQQTPHGDNDYAWTF